MLQKTDWYNILTDPLPESVDVDGTSYPIHTNFKDWISFFLLHEDRELTDVEKITVSMNWYRETVPANRTAAYLALQEFAACENLPKSKRKPSGAGAAPVFSYLYDSAYLFADFWRYYQIHLQGTSLHWFAFTALFEGLPEDSSVKQRIAYRCIHTGNIKDNKERNRVIRIQNAIAIPKAPMTASEVGSLFG